MKINLNLDSLAVLLFCGDIVANNTAALTPEEWYEVERKLKSNIKKSPSRLFGFNKDSLIDILEIDEFVAYKMVARLSKVDQLLHALTNLEADGINITTKSEDNYPKSLLSLKKSAPLYIYNVGNIGIANEMISIVGPQTLDRKLNYFVKVLLKKMQYEQKVLVSSDIKGVENFALKTYLQMGGQAICFVSDHMLDKKKTYARYLKEDRLCIMSAVDPYGFFNVTNALDKNMYMCGLSDTQFISASHINSGGVWFTSIQNLHYRWTTPVVLNDNKYNGNIRLLEMGAISVSMEDLESELSIAQVIAKNEVIKEKVEIYIDQMSIFEFID